MEKLNQAKYTLYNNATQLIGKMSGPLKDS